VGIDMRAKLVAILICIIVITGMSFLILSFLMNDNGPNGITTTTSTTVTTTTSTIDPFPLGQTGYSFEKSTYFLSPHHVFFRISADDANISVYYANRTNLLYSIHVTPYNNSHEASIMFVVNTDSWGIFFSAGRQERITIVLGTYCFYNIFMADNSNTNTSITLSNGAWVNGTALTYHDEESHLNLRICNDIQKTNSIGLTGQIICRTLDLEIQPPSGWNGYVIFNESNLTLLENTGWFEVDYNTFRTIEFPYDNPGILLNVVAEQASASFLI